MILERKQSSIGKIFIFFKEKFIYLRFANISFYLQFGYELDRLRNIMTFLSLCVDICDHFS